MDDLVWARGIWPNAPSPKYSHWVTWYDNRLIMLQLCDFISPIVVFIYEYVQSDGQRAGRTIGRTDSLTGRSKRRTGSIYIYIDIYIGRYRRTIRTDGRYMTDGWMDSIWRYHDGHILRILSFSFFSMAIFITFIKPNVSPINVEIYPTNDLCSTKTTPRMKRISVSLKGKVERKMLYMK